MYRQIFSFLRRYAQITCKCIKYGKIGKSTHHTTPVIGSLPTPPPLPRECPPPCCAPPPPHTSLGERMPRPLEHSGIHHSSLSTIQFILDNQQTFLQEILFLNFVPKKNAHLQGLEILALEFSIKTELFYHVHVLLYIHPRALFYSFRTKKKQYIVKAHS